MSPVGKEMHYKNGMKKDADGFTDIEWCSSAVLNSWDDLRRAFMAANARKAIAPTQVSFRAREGSAVCRGVWRVIMLTTVVRSSASKLIGTVYAFVLTTSGLGLFVANKGAAALACSSR